MKTNLKNLSRVEALKLLIDKAAANHPAVVIPRERTLVELLRVNPLKDFLRRLQAANN